MVTMFISDSGTIYRWWVIIRSIWNTSINEWMIWVIIGYFSYDSEKSYLMMMGVGILDLQYDNTDKHRIQENFMVSESYLYSRVVWFKSFDLNHDLNHRKKIISFWFLYSHFTSLDSDRDRVHWVMIFTFVLC